MWHIVVGRGRYSRRHLEKVFPGELEFGEKESMRDQSGTVGRGQVMQDLVGRGKFVDS